MRWIWILAVLAGLGGCGRYFAGPLRPAAQQAADVEINDDGSLTFALNRLEISLQPMSDAQLNRQFASVSAQGAASTNPYTFGNWTPPGEHWTPPRFAVFRLVVNNYEYPKVRIDPLKISLTTTTQRHYQAFSFAQLYEYHQSYWQGRTGQGREQFKDRTELLRRTLYRDNMVFSGQESEGFVVFPVLPADVKALKIHLADIALRFNYADQPAETIAIDFAFEREVFPGKQPPPHLAQ
jgi:predicted small lipoprotein YifL